MRGARQLESNRYHVGALLISLSLFFSVWCPAGSFDHTHTQWSSLLKKYVRQGAVDYRGIAGKGQPALDDYLKNLASVSKVQYLSFSNQQKMAFLINAYNAYTVHAVVENYPISSIREIGSSDGAIWKKKFISLQQIWGRKLSLNELEKDILLAQFREPRLHFALNCASKGCPDLLSRAYTADSLEKQLNSQTRTFMRVKNKYVADESTLYLSEIFKWYAADFTSQQGTVAAYAARYMSKEVQQAVAQGKVKVKYLPYDWSLNSP